MPRTPKRTPKKDWKPVFIEELARCGNVSRAAGRAKVRRQLAYEHRAADPAFAAAWDEAVDVSVEVLEEEARRRAADGTLRPVFQGGKRVGSVREYSDTLLIFLLKARRPNVYRDNAKVVVAGDPSAPIKHEHSGDITVTAADVAAARAVLGAAGGDLHPDGGPQPVGP